MSDGGVKDGTNVSPRGRPGADDLVVIDRGARLVEVEAIPAGLLLTVSLLAVVDFAPLHFTLEPTTSQLLKDKRGNAIWTVLAKPASEQEQENISKAVEADLMAIMRAIRDEPTLSLAGIGKTLGWYNRQSLPDKSKVQKRVRVLEKKKLVERDGERLELTPKGQKRIGAARKDDPD